jgi:dipeptidyl aminopeptidase/acylaminoacyl peptidase
VGGPSAGDEDKQPVRFISSTWFNNSPQYSPDGQKISFGSYRSGYQEVWICNSDGSNPKQLTFFENPITTGGRWSPDGRQIAFISTKEGNYDIYVVSSTGGFPQRLTTETSDELPPSWSRDGRWIYFSSNRTGRKELYKIPAQGGHVVQLTTNGGTEALESTDGQFIYFTKGEVGVGPPGIWRIPIDGGEEIQVHDRGEIHAWAVLEQGICYLNFQPAPATIELLDFASGEVTQVAALEGRPSTLGLSVSPDQRWILYQVYETEIDIMLVENFR